LLLSELTVESLKACSSQTVKEGFKIAQYDTDTASTGAAPVRHWCSTEHQSLNDLSVPQVVLDNEHPEQ